MKANSHANYQCHQYLPGVVDTIDSFPTDCVEGLTDTEAAMGQAGRLFLQKCKEEDFESEKDYTEDELILDGYYDGGKTEIRIIWSHTVNL